MESCDVLVVGGGPAGSTCAWALRHAGFDVIVVDRAIFPRDKVCAGWVTPQVLADLRLDVAEYRQGRTFQAFTGFHVGLIGNRSGVNTDYCQPVSYGIRRCEFDDYLLQRSGARLRLGAPVSSLRRDRQQWVVDDCVTAPMLVGAGGHFCPVARLLNGSRDDAGLVVAQETEFAIDPGQMSSFPTLPERPELYFSATLNGYGWCVRKQSVINIGFGHLSRQGLPGAVGAFNDFLTSAAKVPHDVSGHWRGHAYLVGAKPARQVIGDGVLLIGDAAGLAYPQSGEGIRPAIESGLIAATTIVEAHGHFAKGHLRHYEDRVRQRFGASGGPASLMSGILSPAFARMLGPSLLGTPWFVRHVVLNRWFLHAHEAALAPGTVEAPERLGHPADAL